MYRAYFRKNDMEEPPPMDDGDEDKETPAHVIQNNKAEDESNLEARFYRYGVRPEWLQINRILRRRLDMKHPYCRDLDFSFWTGNHRKTVLEITV